MTRYVDTNILARIITNDVPVLAQEAMAFVQHSGRGELVITDAMLVELFFILEANQRYRYTRAKSVLAFEGILALPQFAIGDLARTAFEMFKATRKLDFADCLLIAASEGEVDRVLSFDKGLLRAVGVH
jgi:predicted nucleic-acid-binding protein